MSEVHRLHPAIPLSPPSPPADGVKDGLKSRFSDYTPHSPASPFMSVATKSYGQPFAETQAQSAPPAAQRSPSPPGSATMSTQGSQQPSMTATASFPTPTNSVVGHARKAPEEFGEDHLAKRQKVDDMIATVREKREPDDDLEASPSICWRRETQPQASDHRLTATGSAPFAENQSHKAEDETTQPAPVEMSLEQLQKNVGEAFHLCKSGKIPSLFCRVAGLSSPE